MWSQGDEQLLIVKEEARALLKMIVSEEGLRF